MCTAVPGRAFLDDIHSNVLLVPPTNHIRTVTLLGTYAETPPLT